MPLIFRIRISGVRNGISRPHPAGFGYRKPSLSRCEKPQAQEPTEVEKTFMGFMRNLGADALELAKGIAAPIYDTDGFTKGIENLMYDDQGEYTTEGLKQMGGAVVDRVTEIVTDPVDAFYDRPLSTGLDVVGTVVPPLPRRQCRN